MKSTNQSHSLGILKVAMFEWPTGGLKALNEFGPEVGVEEFVLVFFFSWLTGSNSIWSPIPQLLQMLARNFTLIDQRILAYE
jgi:hypothetical protein